VRLSDTTVPRFNSPQEPVLPVDATILRFNSPAEPACIFYGRTWDLNFGAWEILGYGF
jgi:hypothetical protein